MDVHHDADSKRSVSDRAMPSVSQQASFVEQSSVPDSLSEPEEAEARAPENAEELIEGKLTSGETERDTCITRGGIEFVGLCEEFVGDVEEPDKPILHLIGVRLLNIGSEAPEERSRTSTKTRKKPPGELFYSVDLVPTFEITTDRGDKELYVAKPIKETHRSVDGEMRTMNVLAWRRSFSMDEKEKLATIDADNGCRKQVFKGQQTPAFNLLSVQSVILAYIVFEANVKAFSHNAIVDVRLRRRHRRRRHEMFF